MLIKCRQRKESARLQEGIYAFFMESGQKYNWREELGSAVSPFLGFMFTFEVFNLVTFLIPALLFTHLNFFSCSGQLNRTGESGRFVTESNTSPSSTCEKILPYTYCSRFTRKLG